MERIFWFSKNPKGLLIIALALIIISSFLASMFNSSFFSVNVSKVEFETERGTLTGLLYMPRGAGPNDPRPVIVTTHGYLNTKEMQDAPSIEMARRGFIVLALDMYDHGNSRWDADIAVGGQFGTFWIHSQFDAAKWAYDQPFTKKDASGNGLIAVSGHSMGGFSSFIAMFFDEMQALQTGYRMIHAGIAVGSDFSFSTAVAPQPLMQAAFGSRTVGIIAGNYDEFFYNHPDSPAGQTVMRNDYPATPSGRMFLGIDPTGTASAPSGSFHTVDSGVVTIGENDVRGSQRGSRIIYTPNEIHPWNHFSALTTSHLIDFYAEAFSGVISPSQQNANLPSSSQIWQFKVLFNFLALIGFFLLIGPVMSLLLKLPFFNKAITEETAPVPIPDNPVSKFIFWVFIAIGALYPAYIFPTLMNKTKAELTILGNIALIICAVFFIIGIIALAKKHDKDSNCTFVKGGLATALMSLVVYLLAATASTTFALSYFFVAPTVNQIVYWAVVSGSISALITFSFYYFSRKRIGATGANYGLAAKSGAVIASLITAVCGVVLVYIVLFLMDAVFKVDFRIWTLAVRVFTWEHVLTTFRYIPFFFLFYFINTISLNANTRGRKLGCLIAVCMNIGGLALWMIIHYGMLFNRGVAWYPAMALNAILLFALIPCLGIAALYARSLYRKTNNVYLAAFTNTILFTLITVANTAVFWNMV